MAGDVQHDAAVGVPGIIGDVDGRDLPGTRLHLRALDPRRQQLTQRLHAVEQTGRRGGPELDAAGGHVEAVAFISKRRIAGKGEDDRAAGRAGAAPGQHRQRVPGRRSQDCGQLLRHWQDATRPFCDDPRAMAEGKELAGHAGHRDRYREKPRRSDRGDVGPRGLSPDAQHPQADGYGGQDPPEPPHAAMRRRSPVPSGCGWNESPHVSSLPALIEWSDRRLLRQQARAGCEDGHGRLAGKAPTPPWRHSRANAAPCNMARGLDTGSPSRDTLGSARCRRSRQPEPSKQAVNQTLRESGSTAPP